MRYQPPSIHYRYGYLSFEAGYQIPLEDWYENVACREGSYRARHALARVLATKSNEISLWGLKYLWDRDEKKKGKPFPFAEVSK